MTRRFIQALALAALLGCAGDNDLADLQDFLQEVEGRPVQEADALPDFPAPEPFTYGAGEGEGEGPAAGPTSSSPSTFTYAAGEGRSPFTPPLPEATAGHGEAGQSQPGQPGGSRASQQPAAGPAQGEGKGEGEQALSMDFQDIEVRAALQLIADFAGLNLVAGDAVGGRVTLRLKAVPWEQALDVLLKTRGLDKRFYGSVLLVAPAAELKAQEELQLQARRQLQALEPLETAHLQVNYANASELFALFRDSGGEGGEGVVSARGSVIVDDRTNSIILTETSARIAAFREVLAKLDVPVRQVLIEARIVTVNTSVAKSLGFRWGLLGAETYGKDRPFAHLGDSLDTLGEIRKAAAKASGDAGNATLAGVGDSLLVDLGRKGPVGLALGLLGKNFLLELELDALETEGKGEVIARPKVITADRQVASIASGTQIPYQEAAAEGATAIAFVDAVLGLRVRPRITPDGRIIMDLKVSQDSVGEIFNGVPSINTNSIETQVLVSHGDTVVLGGVFTTTSTQGMSRTPFFSRLPVIGRLFRSRHRSESKSELLIFITPRLLPSR